MVAVEGVRLSSPDLGRRYETLTGDVLGGVWYSQEAVEGMPVSASSRETMRCVEQAPLSTVNELSAMYGRSIQVIHRGLNELMDRGMVDRHEVGGRRGRRLRWHLTEECKALVGAGFGLWHDEWALCRLLERMPAVEAIYDAAGQLSALGRLRSFQWFGRAVWDAAVVYERGWAVFLWAGLWQDERRLRVVMGRLGPDLNRLRAWQVPAWPAVVCFVVHDEWQRELVVRAARREGLEDSVVVWCVSDRQWSGDGEPEGCRGWVTEFVYARETAEGLWKRRVRDSVWNVVGGEFAWRVLLAVVEWERITLAGLRRAVGEARRGRRVVKLVQQMLEAGLITRVRDGGQYRYEGSVKLQRVLAGLDRVRRWTLPGGYGRTLGVEERGLLMHENGVLDVMCGFMEAGLPVGSGWRSWEHLGGGGGLAPDGMVYLEVSPFGPGWHYVEYERRARGRVRVGRKLRGYSAEERQDDWPVVFVVEGDLMEETCQEVGREMGVKILTTTKGRLRQSGGVKERGVWSLFGEDVVIG